MTEETPEQPLMADYTNGENPVVPDDILQNMRRGLFGKSAGAQEEESSNGPSETQENSNDSADTTDDPMKNGLSMEDKEATTTKSSRLQEEKEDSAMHIEEADPKEVEDSGEESTPVVEEPAEEPMEEDVEAEPEEAEIEIREVVGQVSPSQVIAVEPIVIEPSLQGQEVVEAEAQREEEDEEEAVVPQVEISEEAEEEAGEEEQEQVEEQNAVPDDPVHTTEEECRSPPPTPTEPNEDEEPDIEVVEPHITEEEPEEEAVEEKEEVEEEVPKSRSRRSVKAEQTPKTPARTPRGRRRKIVEDEEEEKAEATPRSSRRGERAKEEDEVEEQPVEEEEEVKTISSGTKRGRGKEKEEAEEKEETPVAKRSTRRGRGQKEESEQTTEEPKSTGRRRRGQAREPSEEKIDVEENDEEEVEVEASTPKRGSKRGKTAPKKMESEEDETKVVEEKEEEDHEEPKTEVEEEPEEEVEVKISRSSRRGARTKATPRGKKAKAEKEDEEEKEESGSEEEQEEEIPKTRSLRARGAKSEPKATPAKTPARSRAAKKVKVEDEEEEEEEPKEQLKTPKGRGKTKKVVIKTDEPDPYDMDTQLDAHPDPLKNVVVSEGLFGSHKYGKIGSGKYTFTERAAEERVGNLSDFIPKQVNRRSLADLTPGRRRQTAPAKGAKSAPPARKRKTTETDDDEMDLDQPGSSTATPVSRKRKTSPAPASAAKKANKEVELPALSADSQWIVDHPPDEHAPIEIGARVYAVFSKVYYPAVVVAERDGLGRYKVKFIEDAVVRDIPAQGIVPLRAVVAEKECYYGDEGAIIMACPNAASASEWTKAIFTIRLLDNEGEVKGNDIKCDWSKLSLDMNDWKDYIHQKSIEATAVATDNIAHTRTRRHAETPKTPSTVPVTPVSKKKQVKKQTKATPRKDDEEGEDILAENEKAENESDNEAEAEEEEDNNIFSGMVFLLTSAQRDGNNTFKKKMLVDFIQSRGGLVVEDFHDLELHNDMQPFLISDTFYRTHKYLSALAKGVPCVSHEWIHKCIEVEEAVDYNEYILPAGTSSIDNHTYPAPQNQNSLLRGKNVLVYSGGMNGNPRAISYYNIWEPLVVYMGGRALRHLTDITREEKLDVILTDNTVTEVMLERAERDNSWVVTSEWLIHAIIMDRLTDPEEYPRFKVQKSLRPAPSDPE